MHLKKQPFSERLQGSYRQGEKTIRAGGLDLPARPHLPGFRARDARDEAPVSYLPFTALDFVWTV